MAKKGGSTPVPDPVAISGAQTDSNLATARAQAALNRVGTSGPTGTTSWQETAPDQWTQTTTLSPEQQQLYNQSTGLQSQFYGAAGDQLGRAQQSMAQGLNLSGLPALTGQIADAGTIQRSVGANDFSADRQRVEDALYARQTSRLDPQYEALQRAQETKLANQGIGLNSAAYGNASDQFGRQRNDAYAGARNDSILAGGQEQSRLFDMDLAQGNFANAAQAQQYGQNANNATFQNNARQQGFQERSYEQALPLQQLQQLMGLTGGYQAPEAIQYSPTAVAPTDVTGAYALQQKALEANAAQKQAAQSGLMNGLFGLGAAALAIPTGGASLGAYSAAQAAR